MKGFSKVKGRKVKNWFIVMLVIIPLMIFFGIEKSSFGSIHSNEKPEPDLKSYYGVFPVEIPDTLYFAGERVPLEYFDVTESLDRELLSNVYFHSQTIRYIKLAHRYFPVIEKILAEQGIPDDFKYLTLAESGLANVVSPAGAVGFWQIRKGTAVDYGLEVNSEVDERYHLEKSTVAACKYIKESYEKYGNWTTTAASYNVGRRGIDRQMDRQKESYYYDLLLNEETARYIFRILSFKLILEDSVSYGFHISKKELYLPLEYRTVDIDGPVSDFASFAKENGTNYKMLKYLNPWLRDNKLTNSSGKVYQVKIIEGRNSSE